MQCRGEWKLARGDSNPGMCVSAPCGTGCIPLGMIFLVAVGIATLNPRLNMDYPRWGYIARVVRHADVAGDLPVAPTATRCNPWCIFC
ncbi:MAG: hypothetical protein K2G49_11385 [Muribaculum sp.]|nr:hypothetical protein [Muribaculum sp.]